MLKISFRDKWEKDIKLNSFSSNSEKDVWGLLGFLRLGAKGKAVLP